METREIQRWRRGEKVFQAWGIANENIWSQEMENVDLELGKGQCHWIDEYVGVGV